MAKRRATQDVATTEGSGDVLADLGFPHAGEDLTKARLAAHIRTILRLRRLTQAAAAKLMGIDQPKVSAVVNGRLEHFSSERLMRLLTALGHDIEIAVSAEPRLGAPGRIRVSGAMTYPEPESGRAAGDPGFREAASAPPAPARRRNRRA
jgi:predicted XRE-type DNA-binding protein